MISVARQLAGALLMWAAAGSAQAHKASDAYLILHVDGATIEQRVDIALRDIDRDLALDADGDGNLNWGEVRRRWGDIEHLMADGVRVKADGVICRATMSAAPQLDEHVDGRYAVLRQTLQCPRVVRTLELDYRLFVSSDPTHRGIARIVGQRDESLVLVPGDPARRFDVTGTPASNQRSFFGFAIEGMHHIAVGLDHVLFLVTLLLVAVWRRDGRHWVPRSSAVASWKETLRLVTAFTLAHSLTLGLAVSGVIAPPSRWVESLIAVSVLVAAVDNLRPIVRGPRWLMVMFFGLVHGLGFAGPLQDLGLRRGEILLPLLGFNLGVELGQLTLVALLLPLACALRGARWYRLAAVQGGSAAIAVLALAWTVERGFQVSVLP